MDKSSAMKLTPNMSVKSIEETVAFYENVLGFTLVMAVPKSQDSIHHSMLSGIEYVYALVAKDSVELMFQQDLSFKTDIMLADYEIIGASVSFYIEVHDIEVVFQKIKASWLETTPIKESWYGMKEFYLKDINGYILGFAENAK